VKLQFRLKNGETHEIAFPDTVEIHRAIVCIPKGRDGQKKEDANFVIIPDDVEEIEVMECVHSEKELGTGASASVNHKKTEIKIEDASNIESRKTVAVGATENCDNEFAKTVEIRSQVAAENCETPRKANVTTQPTPKPTEKPDALLSKFQLSDSEEKAPRDETAASNTESEFSDKSPKGCPHFFGYLRYLPKGSIAPHYCYSCPIMVDCYAIDRASIDESLCALARAIKSDIYGC
jgi:hypothetical protein